MQEEFTFEELKVLIYLCRNRLNYEARKKKPFMKDGHDVQNTRVLLLAGLKEKLERMQLEQ